MYSETGGQSRLAATYQAGITGGRPGLNALNVTRAVTVSAEEMAALKKVKDAAYAHRLEYANPVDEPRAEPAGQVDLFGEQFKVGHQAGRAHLHDESDAICRTR